MSVEIGRNLWAQKYEDLINGKLEWQNPQKSFPPPIYFDYYDFDNHKCKSNSFFNCSCC